MIGVNISRQVVSKWERDEAKPDIDKLILIVRLFNVSIDYLFGYEIYNVDKVDPSSDTTGFSNKVYAGLIGEFLKTVR